MDDQLVVDSIGPSLITMTVAGAMHSTSISPGTLRMSMPGKAFNCDLEELPLIYSPAELKGKITICDGTGRFVYSWRLSACTQSQSAERGQSKNRPTTTQEVGVSSSAGSLSQIEKGSFLEDGQVASVGGKMPNKSKSML